MGNPVATHARICAIRRHTGDRLAPRDEPFGPTTARARSQSRWHSAPLLVLLVRGGRIARSIFRKGADFTAAMAFEMASTNLVLELSIILIVLHRVAVHGRGGDRRADHGRASSLFCSALFLRPQLLQEAKRPGRERHRRDEWRDTPRWICRSPLKRSLWQRITSDRGLTAISHYFVMDFAAVWMDIVGGLVIAGAIAAWAPEGFLERILPERSSGSGYTVGADRRAARRYHFLRLLGREHSRSPPCCGTAASASAACSLSSRPT